MRIIKFIGVHCTAGPLNQTTDEILAYWRNSLGWSKPGYHEIISEDGTFEQLLPIEEISNGVKGFNSNLINICCKGGIDGKGNPIDNRTSAQKKTLEQRIRHYKKMFPDAVVLGHRDFSTDQNGNGIIERWEFIKSCPGYDVRDWLHLAGLETVAKPVNIVYKLNYPLVKDEFVRKIQQALEKKGYNLKADGIFGKNTSESLKAFQSKQKISPTGIADNFTISLLGIR